jgi:hypothetical protein
MSDALLDKVKELVFRRKRSYHAVFDNPEGARVLTDLARFCRAGSSTFHPDSRVSATLEGRREVWLRIQQHLNLSEQDLWSLLNERMKQ